jgi:hypothetical protein
MHAPRHALRLLADALSAPEEVLSGQGVSGRVEFVNPWTHRFTCDVVIKMGGEGLAIGCLRLESWAPQLRSRGLQLPGGSS